MRLHQTKKFLHSKGNHDKTKRQTTKRKKIFANNTTNKELMPKIYKELLQLDTKKNKQINKKKKNGQRS